MPNRYFDTVNFVGASTVFTLDDFFTGNHAISIQKGFIDLPKGQSVDDRVIDADDTLRVTTDINPSSFVSQPYSNDPNGFRVGTELVTWAMMGIRPPVAAAGTLFATEDTATTGTLLATDVDNTTLTYTVVSQPANGSVIIGANGAYTYTPAANFNGSDIFTLAISSPKCNSHFSGWKLRVDGLL
jgi:hypothetical protein